MELVNDTRWKGVLGLVLACMVAGIVGLLVAQSVASVGWASVVNWDEHRVRKIACGCPDHDEACHKGTGRHI